MQPDSQFARQATERLQARVVLFTIGERESFLAAHYHEMCGFGGCDQPGTARRSVTHKRRNSRNICSHIT